MRLNNGLYLFLIVLFILPTSLKAQEQLWDKKAAKKWYNQKNWLNPSEDGVKVKYDPFGRIIEGGDANMPNRSKAQKRAVSPHSSIDVLEFAKQYHARMNWWTKVFDFIQYNDLDTLKAGKYKLDGDNVIYTVLEVHHEGSIQQNGSLI